MKKYHRLILLAISVVSLSLFLIYRHQYNRLHYVLEVLNFFGQPCNVSELQFSDSIQSHYDWGPLPVWQENEHNYIYSAFLTGKNKAKAIAVVSDVQLVPRNCYFWFEEKKKPLVGKFSFSKAAFDNGSILGMYFYNCLLKNSNIPFAVSFSYNKSRKDNDLRKVLLVKTFDQQPKINTTICVSPSLFSKRRFIEFLSYHKLIGVDSFIFYDREIPHRLSKFVRNLSNRLSLETTYLPWNFPKPETSLSRTIVENDCLLRTSGQTNYVTTLELNEYIVPVNVYSLNALLAGFSGNSDRLALPVLRFCINNVDLNIPISMQNTQLLDDYNFSLVRYINRNIQRRVESTFAIDKELAAIHKYVRCGTESNKKSSHKDGTILKYATDLTRSTLVQLLLHDQI